MFQELLNNLLLDLWFHAFPVIRNASTELLRLLILQLLALSVPQPYDTPGQVAQQYDFIVVGGGTAGCVVAGRLVGAGATVLVLEAGSNAPPESAVPGLLPLLIGSNFDYHIKLNPQRDTQRAFVNNASFLALGRGIGGGSAINGMVYTRGDQRDYNLWASLGNTGWDYKSVLPFFKKSEDFLGYRTSFTDEYHGKGGPLRVEAVNFQSKVSKAFLKAGKELGYNVVDENGPTKIGFTPLHFTVKNGRRLSTAEAFLRPVSSSPNLKVLTDTVVQKIVFNENKHAKEVQFISRGRVRKVKVGKEVIVSAGAIFSPKLLMLSGVGPADHLRKHNIPVVEDVPGVGRNFHDHQVILSFPFSVNNGSAFTSSSFSNITQLIDYINHRSGFYSEPFGIQGSAFVKLDNGDDPLWPNIQVLLINHALSNFGYFFARLAYDMTAEVYNTLLLPLEGKETIVLAPLLMRPKSRGFVTLRSGDYRAQPIVSHNFLSDPADEDLLIRALQFALNISRTSAMKKIGTSFNNQPLHGCTHLLIDSYEYWQCYVRHLVSTAYHPGGTCKMAPHTDPLGVVSPDLEVRGVSGVRVADGSVMPTPVSGNSMGSIIMIGEKAADIIMKRWGYSVKR